MILNSQIFKQFLDLLLTIIAFVRNNLKEESHEN
uniref:Uncharacterized protein n=1 Tax=Dulem virus 199 TaxID=3145676 RepID=A0AAU8B768_9VIRU